LSESPPIAVREAVPTDSRIIWEWRNERRAREASFDSREIPFVEHERWLATKMADPAFRILIGMDRSGNAIGYARFGRAGDHAEISVALDARSRGRGLGSALIRAASERILADNWASRIVARVKSSNAASLAAFEAAGYLTAGWRVRRGADAAELVFGASDPAVSVLFRVDAGRDVGIGHLQRCLSLASALRSCRIAVRFLINDDEQARSWVERAGFSAELARCAVWTARDAADTARISTAHGCTVVVLDSDHLTTDFLHTVHQAGLFVCVIDDLALYPFPCQLVVNGNANAASLRYRSLASDTRFLLGPRYAILRPEFSQAFAREIRDTVERVLVVMGGADPQGLLVPITRLLLEIPDRPMVTVIAGPFAEGVEGLRRLEAEHPERVSVIATPTGVRELMERADVAVSAAGQTLYELACVGTPTIAIQVADNQRGQLDAFVEAGFVVSAGSADGTVANRAVRLVAELAGDARRRSSMAAAGKRVVDGQGARRVVATMSRLVMESDHEAPLSATTFPNRLK
jgi:UDP-2,4-diacetamido-2,4,6-trideoxy-beta-L-altropyranose hydrolase